MGVYKTLTPADVVVSPFEVNKSFTFIGASSLSGSNVQIDRFIGRNLNSSLWVSGSGNVGQNSLKSKELLYNSIKHLYYSNYLEDPKGDAGATASFNIDGTITGPAKTTNNYNYLSDTLNPNRIFPTEQDAIIGVISIPSNLFGEYLQPGSFNLTSRFGTIIDDSKGNLLFSSSIYNTSSFHVGNIIYEHGISIINRDLFGTLDGYGYITYGTASLDPEGIYGGIFSTFLLEDNVTCSFNSTLTLHESQYKCTIRDSEYNFTFNPSTITGSCDDNTLKDFITGSNFSPYITTIGLYNNERELIAVGKLAQPLPISTTTDTTILINIDL